MKTRTMTIRHSPEEWRAWRRAARAIGHETVSGWARAVLNAAARRTARAEIEVEGEVVTLGGQE